MANKEETLLLSPSSSSSSSSLLSPSPSSSSATTGASITNTTPVLRRNARTKQKSGMSTVAMAVDGTSASASATISATALKELLTASSNAFVNTDGPFSPSALLHPSSAFSGDGDSDSMNTHALVGDIENNLMPPTRASASSAASHQYPHLSLHQAPHAGSAPPSLASSLSSSSVAVPASHHGTDLDSAPPTAFFSDTGHIALLIVLYLLQGIPLGLSAGTLPFLLQSKLSYAEIGIFSLASYPYSLKLLWSPVVDSIFWPALGRRKTWIVPVQFLLSAFFLVLGARIDTILADGKISIHQFALLFFVIIVCAATQDIAVDGMALEVLSFKNRAYASTCQTVGLTSGFFISFTIFLAFNSPEFCNSYIRTVPSDTGIFQLGPFMTFWGVMYFVITAWIAIFYREPPFKQDPNEEQMSMRSVYGQMWSIIKLPQMKALIGVLLVYKIGFVANDSVSTLKLVEKGFNKKDLGLTALIDFPCQIILGVVIGKLTGGKNPMRPWFYALLLRLALSISGVFLVWSFPAEGVTSWYFACIVVTSLLLSFSSTAVFVAQGAFFARISDPTIGGTYLTLLNTVANFGGTWPRFFILNLVDMLTVAHCEPAESLTASSAAAEDLLGAGCVSHAEKEACRGAGGKCVIERDGFYIVSWVCFVVGLLLMVFYVRRVFARLETVKEAEWKLSSSAKRDPHTE